MSDARASQTGATATEDRVERLPRWLIGIGATLGLGYAAFVVLLWRLGLFDVPKGGPDARIFAAVFALLGGLFGAILTFTAALLKHTLDTRTLDLSRQTEARLAQENRQLEDRLRLDTAIRAVELLATSEGKKSPAVKQAGSLFALANLGQLDLALALLGQTWPDGDVSTDAAIWVVDRGLRSDQESIQVESARVYFENAPLAVDALGFDLPSLMWPAWQAGLPWQARSYLLEGMVVATASVQPSDWTHTVLHDAITYFDSVRNSDPDGSLQALSGMAMRILLQYEDSAFPGRAGAEAEELLAELENFGDEAVENYLPSVEVLRSVWKPLAPPDAADPKESADEAARSHPAS